MSVEAHEGKEDALKTATVMVLAVLTLVGLTVTAAPVHSGTNVNINLGIPVPAVVAPQPVYVEQPPEMVVIPHSNVCFASGVSVDLFFYDNRWWNRRGDRWYRASGYNGPWTAVGHRYVPTPVYRVPADYRTVYVHQKRVPYGQWKKMHGEHGGKYKGGKHGQNHGYHDD